MADEKRMACPYIETAGKFVADPIKKRELETMSRDECVQDECKHYKECWKDTKIGEEKEK